MACEITTLLGNANCFQCVPPGQWALLRLAMLCRIANGDTSVCNVETLLNEASCFQCLTPGQQQLVELSLLCSIATGGGGGGGSDQIKNYVADPNSEGVVPGDLTKGAIAYPTVAGAGPQYQWDVGDQNWQ